MKQTAVDWLFTQMSNILAGYETELNQSQMLEQAKEMEKEQIIDAWMDDRFPLDKDWVKQCAEQYYNETFKQEQ